MTTNGRRDESPLSFVCAHCGNKVVLLCSLLLAWSAIPIGSHKKAGHSRVLSPVSFISHTPVSFISHTQDILSSSKVFRNISPNMNTFLLRAASVHMVLEDRGTIRPFGVLICVHLPSVRARLPTVHPEALRSWRRQWGWDAEGTSLLCVILGSFVIQVRSLLVLWSEKVCAYFHPTFFLNPMSLLLLFSL